MASTIRIKRRLAGGASGAPTSLANAELAFNEQDDTLYYGKGTGGAGGSASNIIAIAGPGAFATLSTSQTITNKTFGSGSVWNGGVISATYGGTGVNNGSNTITLGGNISTAGAFTTSGAFGITFTATNTTSVTLPTTGTLATLAGSETFTNKTLSTGSTWNGNTIGVAYGGTGTTNGSITGTGALTFTAGGTNTNVNLVPNGTGTVDVASKRITSVATPTQDSDAATKGYVDATRTGLSVKDAVRVATTANLAATYNNGTSGVGATLTNSGAQVALSIDGISLSVGNRVLVKDQNTALQNGVYEVTNVGSGSTNWVLTRATDSDNSPAGEIGGGDFVFVQEGTSQADNGYVVTTDGAITVGTTSITWAQFSGAGQVIAGNGLTKTGNTLDVNGTANRITVGADAIDIASTYAGQTSITTLGTIGTGTWQGSLIGPTYGGTGVNNGSNTITLGGNISTAGSFTTSGAFGITLTATGTTSVTLPTTGTLATTSNKLSAFAPTTSAELAGVISDETGSGALVFATSPTLVTPTLGAATATTINKVTITAPASGSTLTIADGKTLTVSNTLTFTGTDSSSVAFGAGGTVAYTANKLNVFAATTSAELAGVISDETGTGALVFGTSPSLTTPSLSAETYSTTNNVTAGTNSQGQGALTSNYNVITTAAANPSGVTLPTATQGRRIIVVNRGANPVNVYPATGAQIDGLAANASIQIPVNGYMEFNASSTTQWYSSFNATVTGTGVTSFSAGTTGLTPNSATTGAITLGGTLAAANGGTGQSSYTIGDILYASSSTALAKLAAVATGNVLISGGVGAAPSWGKVGLTTHISGTLAVGNGGTGLTTATTNGIIFGNGTNAFGVTAAAGTSDATDSNQLLTVNGSGVPVWTSTLDGGTF